jgi:hypothetical protein
VNTAQADHVLAMIRAWSLPITILGYYLFATFACIDGVFRDLMGHHGHHSKVHKLLWQFHTGAHIHPFRSYGDEKRLKRTASASNRATPEGETVYFTRWHRPQRAASRNAIVVAILSTIWGLVFYRLAVVQALAAFVTVAAFAGIAVVIYRLRRWHAKRPRSIKPRKIAHRSPVKVEDPAYAMAGVTTEEKPQLIREDGVPVPVLAGLVADGLGVSTQEAAHRLTVDSNRGNCFLPDHYAALQRQREVFEEIVRAQTPVTIAFSWVTDRSPRQVSWEPRITSLPTMVRFRDYADRIEKLPLGDFGLGVTVDMNMFTATHNGDRPWWLRSAGPGTGKSTSYQIKLATICHNDPAAEVYCIDTKQVSFHDMGGIPGVHIYEDPESNMDKIYNIYYLLEREMRNRYSAVRRHEKTYDDFDDVWVLTDEGNDLAGHIKAYYDKYLRNGGPAAPPIWSEAIQPLINLGRQVHIRGEFMFQNMTDKALGGISLRDSFYVRCMAGYTKNQWSRIIGSKYQEPKNGVGRVCVCQGPSEVWIQGFYDEPEYLKEYAMANRRAA